MTQAEVSRTTLGNGIELAWDEFGDPDAPPLLLIMGLGAQMIAWREGFCETLVERGLRVIRFDNRDVGLSSRTGADPDLQAVMGGDLSGVAYTLDDMADDAAGLLDALGIEAAHVAGASLGGMIAQTLAVRHPQRVRTLTSIMSTTGRPGVANPTEAAAAVLMGPRPTTADEAAARAVEASGVWGSRDGLVDLDAVRELAQESFERSFDPRTFPRQLAAVYASGDRTEALGAVTAPTLVIHGAVDNLIPPAGGQATAEAIPGAELMIVESMGHDLPRSLWGTLADAIAGHVAKV